MQLTPRDKRMLQILGVVGGLALIYFVFTNVLGGDGGELAAPDDGGGVSTPSPTPTTSPLPTPRETLPPVDLVGARDPFSIPPGLQPSPSGSVAPTGTATTTPPTSTFTTPPPTTPPPTTPPPTSPPPTSPPPTSPPPTSPPPGGGGGEEGQETDHIKVGGHDVQLVSVNTNGELVQVDVDGKVYTVEEGALFDENFKLVKIKGTCARFLFGDQSFTLCEKPKK